MAVSDFSFDLVDSSPGLPVTIGVAGWLSDNNDSCWAVRCALLRFCLPHLLPLKHNSSKMAHFVFKCNKEDYLSLLPLKWWHEQEPNSIQVCKMMLHVYTHTQVWDEALKNISSDGGETFALRCVARCHGPRMHALLLVCFIKLYLNPENVPS